MKLRVTAGSKKLKKSKYVHVGLTFKKEEFDAVVNSVGVEYGTYKSFIGSQIVLALCDVNEMEVKT